MHQVANPLSTPATYYKKPPSHPLQCPAKSPLSSKKLKRVDSPSPFILTTTLSSRLGW